MKQLTTEAIVLTRTDYGEADRIITLLTPEQGKITLVAKGVRRHKSKLAGGIELFSVSSITYLAGRGGTGLGTLISSRLNIHYGGIVKDITRTMLGYDLIRLLHKSTEDNPEPDYFELLQTALVSLNQPRVSTELIKLWFIAQLIRLAGHSPNLQTDTAGQKLHAEGRYDFSYDDMSFLGRDDAKLGADEIKFLRLVFNDNPPAILQNIDGVEQLVKAVLPLLQTMQQLYLRT